MGIWNWILLFCFFLKCFAGGAIGVFDLVVKIGIIGTRARDTQLDYHIIRDEFIYRFIENKDRKNIGLVSGGCHSGGDRFAEIIAKEFEIPINIYHAEWNKYGNSAGAIRNKKIAEESDWLIACVAPDRKGGTEITIKEFIKQKGEDKLIIV